MIGRAIGWTVSLGVAALGAGLAAFARFADDDTKRKAVDSARLLRDRSLASAAHLSDQARTSATELREQWTGTAIELRDRWTTGAEEFRARAVDTAGDWRDRSTENIERRIRQAAEARDDALETEDDED